MDYYHTQEKRSVKLSEPIKCKKDNAWLGDAYYFWEDESDAIFWGIKSKKTTGEYEIYKVDFEDMEVLDTVFNRIQYDFFIRQIEKVSKKFVKKTGIKPTLKEINDYFLDNNIWTKFDGILFQDISNNPDHYLVKGMQYKKRIQLALYNKNKIRTFAPHFDGYCE